MDILIFVALSTQDKPFTRLLKAIEKEIINGTIKDKVIVQAGITKYESKYMEIFDLVPGGEYDEYIKNCNLLITHGGVATILTGIRNNKKVIAVPRLKKYGEHVNDHQTQIIKQFKKDGYIMSCTDLNKLGKIIEKSKTFKPKKCEFDNSLMLNTIKNFIDNN